MSSSISIQSNRAAQGARSAARNPRRTNREMVLKPLWEGYLRAIHQQLRRSVAFGARYRGPDCFALRDAAEMLDAFAVAVEARRYVAARRTKAERLHYERICLLLSQIEHTARSVNLAQATVSAPHTMLGVTTAATLIDRAIAELPKMDQIAGIAIHLGFAACLGQMVATEFLF